MYIKSRLRKIVTEKRSIYGGQTVQSVSLRILDKLKNVKLLESKKIVHVYLPIARKNEIDTWPVVKWLLEAGHEVWTSYLPEDESEDGFCLVREDTTYGIGRYGIPLPQTKVEKDCTPDVVIVPCLAADVQGNRLGYGSGWYDWFLANHKKAVRIGLVYGEFLYDEIPHTKDDQQLDVIVTERKIIHTGRI